MLSALLATATLLTLTTAIPPFTDSAVAYFTNCQTTDTAAVYSEVSLYGDVTQSFSGQNPDLYADTPLGGDITWEGKQIAWSYAGADPQNPDPFIEYIKGNAQDPAVPFFTEVGCATYTEGFSGGAVEFRWNCYKDQPRVLYTTADHECTTLYYCRIAHLPDACPFVPPS